ncbi:MAG: hypothetical protein IKK00_02670 [Oscillospiraceae bacterium]|nr:hypothetical protein [Oscillospiraceae bacterium]MBR6562118.1 hypothetical protein [Oscillospiraceae bacterium]
MINRYLGNSGQVERLPQPGNRPASAHPAPRQNTAKRNAPQLNTTKQEESPRQAPPPRGMSAPSGTRPEGQRSSGGIWRQPAGVSGQGKAGGLLRGLTSKLDLSRLETEDLILLLILYLLYRESGDEEMLIMMGAMLFL